MGEILQRWVWRRLGVAVDKDPALFARQVADGVLLADLLQAYGVLGHEAHSCVSPVTDPRLRLSNLRFLKVFFCLEGKDRLHFLAEQEVEYYRMRQKRPSRFTVEPVPETREAAEEPATVEREEPCISKEELAKLYSEQYHALLRECRDSHVDVEDREAEAQSPPHKPCLEVGKTSLWAVHVPPSSTTQTPSTSSVLDREYTQSELECIRQQARKLSSGEAKPKKPTADVLEEPSRKEIAYATFKKRMQKVVLGELWEALLQEQEKQFDRMVTEKLIKQSQYEKKAVSKLFSVRSHKRKMVENRLRVEKMLLDQQQQELDSALMEVYDEQCFRESLSLFERDRFQELQKRLGDDKQRKRYAKHFGICMDVVKSAVDFGLRVSEFKKTNRGIVPQELVDQWKALFFKGLPIFDVLEGGGERLLAEEIVNELIEEVELETDRQIILDEHDLQAYLALEETWEVAVLAPHLAGTESSLNVLGHVIHRLLAAKYPYPLRPMPADIPRYPVAAALIAELEDDKLAILEGLLKHKAVHVVKMENVINFCVAAFKEECTPDSKAETENKLSKKKAKQPASTPSTKATKEEPEVAPTDKFTQTPVKIPEDGEEEVFEGEEKPREMSPQSKLGQRAFEILGVGEEINDELLASMLIEYLKNQMEINGWVLINFPKTYSQASVLEEKLSGQQMPPESSEDDEDKDPFREQRVSRLLPNPTPAEPPPPFSTYLTAYIHVEKLETPSAFEEDNDEQLDVFNENLSPLEKLYTEQGMNYAFYYESFDFPTLKQLAKTVIGDMEMPLKPSVELFGEGYEDLAEKGKKGKSAKKPPKKVGAKEVKSKTEEGKDELEELLASDMTSKEESFLAKEGEPTEEPAKPGEEGWHYVDLPQPLDLQCTLATIWEKTEWMYTRALKEIFFSKRIHYSHIVPYVNYVTELLQKYIRRPDLKQDAVHEFQTRYNEMDEDLRQDDEIKSELHCRVTELRHCLWEICDRRMKQAETERRKIICESWIAGEMVAFVNLFIAAAEVELDRYIDTLQLISDYYMNMMSKLPSEKRFDKIAIPPLSSDPEPGEAQELDDLIRKSKVDSSGSLPRSSTRDVLTKGVSRGSSVTRSARKSSIVTGASVYRSMSSTAGTRKGAVARILINSDTSFSVQTPYHKALTAAVSSAVTSVERVALQLREMVTAEGTADDKKSKKSTKKEDTARSAAGETTPLDNLVSEWTYCANEEMSRVIYRLNILLARGLNDLTEILNAVQSMFYSLYEEIGDRYKREVESVDNLCQVLFTAIEEEQPIREQLVLEQDIFVVKPNVVLLPEPPPPTPQPLEERRAVDEFRISQLQNLRKRLHRLAPSGNMPERAFVSLLEDCLFSATVEGEEPILPPIWMELQAADLQNIVHKVFGSQECVDWRDFLIYGLDLEYPTEEDILDVRRQFRVMDVDGTETVSFRDYQRVVFWFEKELEEDSQLRLRKFSAKDLLSDVFTAGYNKVSYTSLLLCFCKDEDETEGFRKALALSTGKRIVLDPNDLTKEGFLTEAELMRLAESKRRARKAASTVAGIILDDTIQFTEGVVIEEVSEEIVASASKSGKSREVVLSVSKSDKSRHAVESKSGKSVVAEEAEEEEEEEQEAEAEEQRLLSEQALPPDQSWLTEVPMRTTLCVLAAALPWLTRLPRLRQGLPSLRESVERVYGPARSLPASALLAHPQLRRLLSLTSKFRACKLAPLLAQAAEARAPARTGSVQA
ncbi:sperm flagellar protein 2-like [Schistocerca americana]|uniref:sperm flagellar protein 2-like n=1 Tax=Schistocerca americana TaxID=7009 RepID=UPI001F4F725F|nr:sperm flagellar protein 2-like [Schistocerca americana]